MSETDLETMRPNPVWTEAGYEDAVGTFERLADELVVKVWCGDWCSDCRAQLPDFAAALDAAGVPAERVQQYPVEKADDGSKVGPGVEDYGVTLIPTVVVERVARGGPDAASGTASAPEADGEPVARFEESADVPMVVALARQLEDAA